MTSLTKTPLSDTEFDTWYNDYIKHLHQGITNVDATHRCMLACVFCNRTAFDWGKEQIQVHQKTYGDLTVQDSILLGNSFNELMFCGNISDPIYNPKFLEIMQALNTTTCKKIAIHTNGSHKTVDWWEQLIDICNNANYHIRIVFGIDGIDQKASLHRKNQNFDQSFEAMKLCKQKLDAGEIVWQFIPFKYNEHELKQAKQIAQELDIKFLLLKSGRFAFGTELEPPSNPNLYSFNGISDREET